MLREIMSYVHRPCVRCVNIMLVVLDQGCKQGNPLALAILGTRNAIANGPKGYKCTQTDHTVYIYCVYISIE